MTLEIGFLFALLVVMVYLFLTEKIPVDLTAFAGLVILVLLGYISPGNAFSGFSSSAVITMLAIFIVGAGLLRTGIADLIGGRLYALAGGREIPTLISIMLIVGVLSAFMNNIAATAVMMPAVASLARRSGIPASRLFMPLSFGAILGGTTTLVGTPPNILAGDLMREHGLEPFHLFDFTPLGLVLLVVGILFMILAGSRLLPDRSTDDADSAALELAGVYRLRDQLFSIRIPSDSPLDGRTLEEAHVGSALGVQVVAVERRGKRDLAPGPETVIRGGDLLTVEGNIDDVRQLLRLQGVGIESIHAVELPGRLEGVDAIRVRVDAGSPILGRNLRELGFRRRYGVVVVGILRGGQVLMEQLPVESLRQQDELLCIGSPEQIEEMRHQRDFEMVDRGLSCLGPVQPKLFLIDLPEESPLVGSTVRNSRLGELAGLTVGGVVREGETHLAVSPDEELRSGDSLVVAGEPDRILRLLEFGGASLEPHDDGERSLESNETGVVEASVAPRSELAGRTLGGLRFRERYGIQILAIWREGELLHGNLARVALRFGDALLLQGSWSRIRDLSADPNLVILSEQVQAPRRKNRAPMAAAGLLLMVLMVVTGFQPIHVAAFTAATFIILTGALTMEEAYRAIEWRAIFLVAAILPVGIAMETSGAAQLMAGTVVSLAGPLGPYAVLASLVVLSSLLSQGFDGAPAVVLLAPIAFQAAAQLDISPYPIMMGISLAASAAFMTPFSHKANLLVMGAGGYRSMDYVRVGSPLTVLVLALLVLLVPLFFPF